MHFSCIAASLYAKLQYRLNKLWLWWPPSHSTPGLLATSVSSQLCKSSQWRVESRGNKRIGYLNPLGLRPPALLPYSTTLDHLVVAGQQKLHTSILAYANRNGILARLEALFPLLFTTSGNVLCLMEFERNCEFSKLQDGHAIDAWEQTKSLLLAMAVELHPLRFKLEIWLSCSLRAP